MTTLREAGGSTRRTGGSTGGAAARPGANGWLRCGLLLLLLLVIGCGERADRQFLSIGTGGTGGIYYPLGGAIASQMSVRDTIRQYTAEVTGASVENVSRLRAGQIDLGMSLGVTAYEAYHGGLDYDEPISGLRVVAPLYPNVTHVVVRRGAEIRSVRDLEGHRVSVGSPGSGTEQISQQLLGAVGLGYDDVTQRFLTFSGSASALADGAIDAAIISVGYPAAAVLEATTVAGARLIPVDGETAELLQERHPYYRPGTIPGGVYRGVEDDVPTVTVMNWILAMEGLSSEVVRDLLDVMDQERQALIDVHEMARQIDLDDLLDAPIPLHPAAEEWLARVRGTAAPAPEEPPAPEGGG